MATKQLLLFFPFLSHLLAAMRPGCQKCHSAHCFLLLFILTCLQQGAQVARSAIQHIVVEALHRPLGPAGSAVFSAACADPWGLCHPPSWLDPLPAMSVTSQPHEGGEGHLNLLSACATDSTSHISAFHHEDGVGIVSLLSACADDHQSGCHHAWSKKKVVEDLQVCAGENNYPAYDQCIQTLC